MTYRERRDAGGWSLETVAALANINISTLYRIEHGRAKPNRNTARAIDAALAILEAQRKTEAAS